MDILFVVYLLKMDDSQ